MSKSLGNFFTIRALLAEKAFGGTAWHGRVLRLAMLQTHYRQPIDWTLDRLLAARGQLMAWAKLVHDAPEASEVPPELVSALSDDLNTPAAMAVLHELAALARKSLEGRAALRRALTFMGLYGGERFQDFAVGVDAAAVEALVVARNDARKARDFAGADRLKAQLKEMGVEIEDGPQGTTWRLLP